MIKGGYAIPAAEQELGRPFTVGHDCGWSATVRHVRPWSAMVGHAGHPWSVTISHEHDSRKHATFPIFYGRDPGRTSCTQNDQVWEGSLSTTKPDVLNPTQCRVMFEYVYVALKYPEINCVVTVRRLFYSRETIRREVWWRVTFPKWRFRRNGLKLNKCFFTCGTKQIFLYINKMHWPFTVGHGRPADRSRSAMVGQLTVHSQPWSASWPFLVGHGWPRSASRPFTVGHGRLVSHSCGNGIPWIKAYLRIAVIYVKLMTRRWSVVTPPYHEKRAHLSNKWVNKQVTEKLPVTVTRIRTLVQNWTGR